MNPAYQSSELEYVLRKVGCKGIVFPKQFKTQQYYDILKQVCPELEKAQPGALKSERWVCLGFREYHVTFQTLTSYKGGADIFLGCLLAICHYLFCILDSQT